MCLGVIYTNSNKFEVLQFFKKERLENFDKNTKIPSIILGKKNSVELLGEVSVLNRQITDNVSWTYNKLEKRSDFEVDIEVFYKNIFKKLLKKIKYEYINIYTSKHSDIKRLYSVLYFDGERKVTYITNSMIYIYCNSTVYGISLFEINYCGMNITKIIDRLTKLPNNEIITSNNFIKNDVKKYINNQNYLTPYLYLLL
jgi:hypothetical protein